MIHAPRPSDTLAALLAEDWEDVTLDVPRRHRYDEDKYYVYAHYDPRDGVHAYEPELTIPFYIGMGSGARYKSTRTRANAYLDRIAWCNTLGLTVNKRIIAGGLSYRASRLLESKLIAFWGCIGQTGPVMSGIDPCLVNGKYEPYPEKYKTRRAKKEVEL